MPTLTSPLLTAEQMRRIRDNMPDLSNRPPGVDLALILNDAIAAILADLVSIEGVIEVDEAVDRHVHATIAVADATGGGTTAALTLQLAKPDGVTPISAARQVMIRTTAAQYSGLVTAGSATFGTATAGSIIASGTGWALVQTDATGAFACTVTNAADETIYFAAGVPMHGVSDKTLAVWSCSSNADGATWSA
mgnify:CR=1 FL=1